MTAQRPSRSAVASDTRIGARSRNLVPTLINRPWLSCSIYVAAAPAGDKLPSKLSLITPSGGEVHPTLRMIGMGEGEFEEENARKEEKIGVVVSIPPNCA